MGSIGGAEGDRTPDLYTASVALSQLSYGPDIPSAGASMGVGAASRIGGSACQEGLAILVVVALLGHADVVVAAQIDLVVRILLGILVDVQILLIGEIGIFLLGRDDQIGRAHV